jgi:glycosyltransferase involved in cell wall biosynthesis
LKLSIIIPVYNERDSIEANLNELENYLFQSLSFYEWEIIVVNDGSNDESGEILAKLQNTKSKLNVINLSSHYGRGRALRTGFDNSSGDIIVTMDADLSYAPYHIEQMITKLLDDNADIVLASAYRKEGTTSNVPFKRLLLSKLGNRTLSYMFGSDITVLTCMVRAYKSEFIKNIDLHAEDKEIHLEILSKAKILGAKIVEIPADLAWRDHKIQKRLRNVSQKRRSTLKIRRISSSHLFFALLSKPGIIFWIPGIFLVLISISMFILLARVMYDNLAAGMTLYHAMS